MRIDGTLVKWNDERGFGFILPTKAGIPEIFVHVSAFPKDGQRPSIGEFLSFEIETDKNGKKRAINLLFPNRVIHLSTRQHKTRSHNESSSFLKRIVSIVVVLSLVFYGYGKYTHRIDAPKSETAIEEHYTILPKESTVSSSYKCDGRTNCSQMASCEEAIYFLEHCPNVNMDGDKDGIPCEQQWCN